MSADGPEWIAQAAQSWKLTLPCTRAQAEMLAGDVPEIAAIEPEPVLMTSEPDPAPCAGGKCGGIDRAT
jgi:ribosomal protein L11 methyltransferase